MTGLRYRAEDLERAFFASRFSRALDALGYATFRRWPLYAEEGLAGREAASWLRAGSLALEHEGQALSRYDVERARHRSLGLRRPPEALPAPYALSQSRLFGLDEAGRLKALRQGGYAARKPRRPAALPAALFPYLGAL